MDLLDLAPMKARLQDGRAPSLRDVGYAADFAAVTAPGAVLAQTGCYLVTTGEEPLPVAEASTPQRQNVLVTISALVAVKFAGQRGEAGLKALKAPCGEVRRALFGWHHPDSLTAFQLAGGGLEDFDGKTGVAVYRIDFAALVTMQEELP